MKINIKKYIITFFILIVTFVIGAEQKIPNVMVLENPVKEVTTIEGLKNKEAAEMNIKVKKRDIEEIEGIETKDGFEFTFPKDKMDASEKIIAIKDIDRISENRLDTKKIAQSLNVDIIENQNNFVLNIPKSDNLNTVYFIKYNDINKSLVKVYKGEIKNFERDMVADVNRVPIEIILKRDSNGNIVSQDYIFWDRKLSNDKVRGLKSLSNGYEDKKIIIKKTGEYSPTSEIEVVLDSKLEIEGYKSLDVYYSKVDFGKDGGFEKNDKFFNMKILSVDGLRSRDGHFQHDYIMYNSSIYHTFRAKIESTNQGNYDKSIGLYEVRREGYFDTTLYDRHHSYGNQAPLRFIAQRDSKNIRITVKEKDLKPVTTGLIHSRNYLSFTALKEFKEILGYYNIGLNQPLNYTLENLTPGGTIEIQKGGGLLFHKDIKTGIYEVRIKLQTDSGTSINGINGDIIAISYENDRPTRAKLDLSEFSVGSYGKWRPMTTGKAQSIEGDPYIMDIMGYLPEVRNAFYKSAVASLSVNIVEDGVFQERITVNGTEGSRIAAELENNTLGFESNGDFFITKKKKSKKTYGYGIVAFDKNGNSLGSYSLDIINDKPIDMGAVFYGIDERLYPKHVGWFDKNGQKFSSIPTNFKNIDNYEEVTQYVNSRFSYPHGVTLTAEGIVGLTKKSEVNGKGFIYGTPGTTKGDTIIPDNVTSEEDFGQKLYVLNNDDIVSGRSITHKLEYIGSDNKYYFIESREGRGNEKVASGVGIIDLSKIKTIGAVHSFSKKLKPGKYTNNGAELSITRNLPQTQGYKKENIVNNLDIIVNGGAPLNVVGNSYENDNYRITLNKDSGDLEVEKLNIDNLYNDTIDITYKYQDIKLGDFRLIVKNEGIFFEIIGDDSINFGEIIQGKDSEIDGKIIVKNLNSKRIVKVEQNANRLLKMKKKGTGILLTVWKTITLLREETEAPIEIRMTAKPKPDQYVGEYEGELNLFIYIE
ncbi:hypothetical protein [Cetobacterium somerae]